MWLKPVSAPWSVWVYERLHYNAKGAKRKRCTNHDERMGRLLDLYLPGDSAQDAPLHADRLQQSDS